MQGDVEIIFGQHAPFARGMGWGEETERRRDEVGNEPEARARAGVSSRTESDEATERRRGKDGVPLSDLTTSPPHHLTTPPPHDLATSPKTRNPRPGAPDGGDVSISVELTDEPGCTNGTPVGLPLAAQPSRTVKHLHWITSF